MHISNNITPISPNFGCDIHKTNSKSNVSKSSNNLLYGTLLALAALNPISVNAQSNGFESSSTEYITDANLTMEFNDKDGYVDMNDFIYSSPKSKQEARNYIKGLEPFQGKKWTQALEDMSSDLVSFFNQGNTYAFDLRTDELVKDKVAIKRRKDGRIASMKLTNSTTGELINQIDYKYDSRGNIDCVTKLGGLVTEYRPDGTRYSVVLSDGLNIQEEYYFNKKGKVVNKKQKIAEKYLEYKYDDDGEVITKFVKNSSGATYQVFNGGELMFETKYDKNDKIVSYWDGYFKSTRGNALQAPSSYFDKKIILSNTNDPNAYPKFYKTEPIDGRIVHPVRQGTSGTCYIAGIINSFVHIPAGRVVLDNMFKNDIYNNRIGVDFDGLGRHYSFGKDNIYKNISRLGRKDADYSAIVKAYENFRLEDLTEEEEAKLPAEFFDRGVKGRMVDSGYPTEIFYAITGKYMSQSGDRITDNDILKAKACLDTNRGIVNAGTVTGKDKHKEISQADADNGISYSHNLSVWDINLERGYVTLYDSVTEKEIRYPIDKFKKYFAKLYYATLD